MYISFRLVVASDLDPLAFHLNVTSGNSKLLYLPDRKRIRVMYGRCDVYCTINPALSKEQLDWLTAGAFGELPCVSFKNIIFLYLCYSRTAEVQQEVFSRGI